MRHGYGGQHRSVALTERVGAELKEEDYHVNITHRDRLKEKKRLIALNENLSNS